LDSLTSFFCFWHTILLFFVFCIFKRFFHHSLVSSHSPAFSHSFSVFFFSPLLHQSCVFRIPLFCLVHILSQFCCLYSFLWNSIFYFTYIIISSCAYSLDYLVKICRRHKRVDYLDTRESLSRRLHIPFHSLVSSAYFFVTLWSFVILLSYGVATNDRLLKIIGLFCKKALQNRLYSAKETYDFKEPTNGSHPIIFFTQVSSCHSFVFRIPFSYLLISLD